MPPPWPRPPDKPLPDYPVLAADQAEGPGVVSAGGKSGFGRRRLKGGGEYIGEWVENLACGRGQARYPSGDTYIGEWAGNRAHGFGVYRCKEGTEYMGQFVHDLQDGSGVETWPNGAHFAGTFLMGKKSGYGVYTWPDGSRYEGQWGGDHIGGYGFYEGADQRTFSGRWLASRMHGFGRFAWPEGAVYEGQYLNDKQDGFGVMRSENGAVRWSFWSPVSEDEPWKDAVRSIAVDGPRAVAPQALGDLPLRPATAPVVAPSAVSLQISDRLAGPTGPAAAAAGSTLLSTARALLAGAEARSVDAAAPDLPLFAKANKEDDEVPGSLLRPFDADPPLQGGFLVPSAVMDCAILERRARLAPLQQELGCPPTAAHARTEAAAAAGALQQSQLLQQHLADMQHRQDRRRSGGQTPTFSGGAGQGYDTVRLLDDASGDHGEPCLPLLEPGEAEPVQPGGGQTIEDAAGPGAAAARDVQLFDGGAAGEPERERTASGTPSGHTHMSGSKSTTSYHALRCSLEIAAEPQRSFGGWLVPGGFFGDDLSQAYKVEETVHRGTRSVVFRGSSRTTGQPVAVKSVTNDRGKAATAEMIRQTKALRLLRHPNICKMLDEFETPEKDGHPGSRHFVMEYYRGGTLFALLPASGDETQEPMGVDVDLVGRYAWQMFSAISYVHRRELCHRDVKLENFLRSTEDELSAVKLIDFGLACSARKDKPMTAKVGTPYYIAPEVLSGSYFQKCDVWSAGVAVHWLCVGRPPFPGATDAEVLRKVELGRVEFENSSTWSEVCYREPKKLIEKVLVKDPASRPSAAAVLSNRWLRQHRPNARCCFCFRS